MRPPRPTTLIVAAASSPSIAKPSPPSAATMRSVSSLRSAFSITVGPSARAARISARLVMLFEPGTRTSARSGPPSGSISTMSARIAPKRSLTGLDRAAVRDRRLLLLDRGHRGRDDRADVAQVRRDDHRVAGPGELAELADVLLGDPELDRLVAARLLNRLGDLADALGRRGRDRQDRRGLALGLVDALLARRLGGLDDLLLLPLGGVDRRVALPFRREDDRALLPLGAHL